MAGTPKRDLPSDNAFHIAFWTTGKSAPAGAPQIPPGYLLACKVTLEFDLLPPEHGPLAESYHVNLVDHPLYKDLQRYCAANK